MTTGNVRVIHDPAEAAELATEHAERHRARLQRGWPHLAKDVHPPQSGRDCGGCACTCHRGGAA